MFNVMGAPLYRCPVCLHSSFSSVTALWQGLMSGASRRLSCPVCQEVLLGLDKLTLHLYSHLPVSSNASSMSAQQESAESIEKHTVAHEFPQSVVSAELLKSSLSNSLEEPSQIPNINRTQVNTNNSHQVNFMNPQFHNVNSPNKCNEENKNEQSTLSWDSNSAILSSARENEDKSPKLNIEFNPISYGSVEQHHQQQQYGNKPEDLMFSADVPTQRSNNDDQGTYSSANDPNPQKQIPTVNTMFQLSLGELSVDTDIHSVLKSTDSEHQAHSSPSGSTSLSRLASSKEIAKESLVPVNTQQSNLSDMSSKPQNKYICYNPELQCSDCGAAFETHSLLTTHTQLVHPATSANNRATSSQSQSEEPICPFACHLCNRRFKMRGSLMVHVRFVHGGLRLVKAAKGLRGSSQLEQTLQQPTSASPPSNSSPEPLFPSLSELSEQLSASPSQISLPNSSTNNQVDVLNSHESVTIAMEESDDVEFDNTEVMHSSTGNAMKTIDANNFSATHQWQEHRDVIDAEKDTISANLVQEATQWMSSPLKCVLAPVNNADFRSQHTSNERQQDWPNQHSQDTLKNSQQNTIQTEINSGKHKVESMHIASKIEFCRKEQDQRISPENNSVKEKDSKLNNHSVSKSNVNNDLNKAYECEVCFKRFTTKYFHKKHQRLHTGERPYTCGTCGKTFAFQQSFHKHLLYHTSAKPHSCAECGQAFKELSTLHNHQRIHTGERPFVCETCGKAFRQRVSYLVHRRIHTGVLPYKCSACNKSFRYKPPGNVIRQSELVQRLLMKAASSLPEVADNASSSAVAMAAGNIDVKSNSGGWQERSVTAGAAATATARRLAGMDDGGGDGRLPACLGYTAIL
ncbi:hypothetical protein B566_EDAN001504, partial [Ephemera danica]